MNMTTFTRLSGRTAATHSRRASLAGLAGGFAVLGASPPMEAKKKKGKKKRKGKTLCQKQQAQCETVIRARCAQSPNPEPCLNSQLPCCSAFGDCNADGAICCLYGPPGFAC